MNHDRLFVATLLTVLFSVPALAAKGDDKPIRTKMMVQHREEWKPLPTKIEIMLSEQWMRIEGKDRGRPHVGVPPYRDVTLIPYEDFRKINYSHDYKPPSLGERLAWGVFARHKSYHWYTLHYLGGDGTESLKVIRFEKRDRREKFQRILEERTGKKIHDDTTTTSLVDPPAVQTPPTSTPPAPTVQGLTGNLEDVMTVVDFRKCGLSKLTDAELGYLNDWISPASW